MATIGGRELAGSVILVTGGTGSFGNRMAGHLKKLDPSHIRIFSRDEKKQAEMAQQFPDFEYLVGDIRDLARLDEAMSGVDYVFHAAALKQVPTCEKYPLEAVKTNVVGSAHVCDSAARKDVRVVVALSTDKAVKPVNAMGMSKAVMEKVVCAKNAVGSGTVFCCVRYGNVMGSRGSVIPLFQRLIEAGQPMRLTNPDMTRFLLTLDQSVDLVLHALRCAQGGEIFVRKAPACTVAALAEAMGLEFSPLGAGHPVTVTGVRPGEKIHEVLVNEYELQRAGETDDYFVIHPEYREESLRSAYPPGAEYTSENTQRLDDPDRIRGLIRSIGKVDYYT